MSELKDCPFCESSDLNTSYANAIYCKKCDGAVELGDHGANTRKFTILAWNLRPDRPEWFTTDKPLPDGDYGFRWNSSYPSNLYIILVVDEGRLYLCSPDKTVELKWEAYYKGEWCPIEFPK